MTRRAVEHLARQGKMSGLFMGENGWRRAGDDPAATGAELARYEGAAARQDRFALTMSARMRTANARSAMARGPKEGTPAWEEALVQWELAGRWAADALGLSEGEEHTAAQRRLREARYGAGCCCFELERYDQALELTEGLEETRAQVLRGVCLFQAGDPDETIVQIYDLLTALERDENYQLSVSGAGAEEDIYAEAVVILSLLYTAGVEGRTGRKLRHAVELLRRAAGQVQGSYGRTLIRNRLENCREGSYLD